MDSDEGYNYEFDDEEEECSEDSAEDEGDDDALDLGEVELVEPVVAGGEQDGSEDTGSGLGAGRDEEDYRYEVLTAEQILQHMVECIREVNEVIQVAGTHSLTVCADSNNTNTVYRHGPCSQPGVSGLAWLYMIQSLFHAHCGHCCVKNNMSKF